MALQQFGSPRVAGYRLRIPVPANLAFYIVSNHRQFHGGGGIISLFGSAYRLLTGLHSLEEFSHVLRGHIRRNIVHFVLTVFAFWNDYPFPVGYKNSTLFAIKEDAV